jgi:hypothetical protein
MLFFHQLLFSLVNQLSTLLLIVTPVLRMRSGGSLPRHGQRQEATLAGKFLIDCYTFFAHA